MVIVLCLFTCLTGINIDREGKAESSDSRVTAHVEILIANDGSELTNSNHFTGSWANVNPETRGITRIEIRYKDEGYAVRMWASCTPEDCDWGEQSSADIRPGASRFDVLWDQDFAESLVTFSIRKGQLKVVNRRHYKDNSGRKDQTYIEYFQREVE